MNSVIRFYFSQRAVVDISGEEASVVLPHNCEKIGDKYLVTTQFGGWSLLSRDEFMSLSGLRIKDNKKLERKLKKGNIIIDKKNLGDVLKEYRNLNRFLFQGPSLHIIAVTQRCNHVCVYCQAKRPDEKQDMNRKTAIRVLDFIFKSPSKAVTIEFQGGEPLLNWDIVEFIVKEARRLNRRYENKDLRIALVSNLILLDKGKLDFLMKNDVSICTSLDGPKEVHDKNRKYLSGKGTHNDVAGRIGEINGFYRKRKTKFKLNALPTITAHSLPFPKEIVNEYVRLGFDIVHMRFLNRLGEAKKNWDGIGYTADEFLDFWKKGLDYIIELNKKGVKISEKMATLMLVKILKKKDPGYTELMSPCGAGTTQLLYDYDGDVYTCDEGRMLGERLFMIGNVNKNDYKDVIRNENLIGTCHASILENYCQACAFRPWCGTCPVMNYAQQGSLVPKITETMRCKIYKAQFTYLFNRMREPNVLKIFEKWANEWEN